MTQGDTCQRLPTSAGDDGSVDASRRDLKHLAAGVKRINEMRAFGADNIDRPVPATLSPLAHLWVGHFWKASASEKWVTLAERRR